MPLLRQAEELGLEVERLTNLFESETSDLNADDWRWLLDTVAEIAKEPRSLAAV